MLMQLSMWEDKMTDLDRFIAIDPCLYEPMNVPANDPKNDLAYLGYLQNEARMHAFGAVFQMYGPGWQEQKEAVCEHFTDKAKCEEYFGPHTADYEPTSTVSVLMARQNSI